MTKSPFDHLDLLIQTHPAAKDIDAAKHHSVCRSRCIPAKKGCYREIGLVK